MPAFHRKPHGFGKVRAMCRQFGKERAGAERENAA